MLTTSRSLALGVAALVLGVAALVLLRPEQATATQFFVDPRGSDRAEGTSVADAWRTVARVNRAGLRPGDEVLFRGRARYEDEALAPTRSGTRGAPIRFTSFGRGRATIAQGVYLRSVSWIELARLRITGASQGVAGAAAGSGARNITIENSLISDVGIGINAPNAADRGWRIVDNTIVRTGDSGIIIEGSGFLVEGNAIAQTGTDSSIDYAKHGIYSKGPGATIAHNRISGFSVEGVSTRFRDARIEDNVIRGGDGGIGYYHDDPRSGTTIIARNRISGVGYGIYISRTGPLGPTVERFRISDNVAVTRTGANLINAPFTGVASRP